ncbi:MAG: 4-(cytidine 5'-diphospho)-2-C-methyl-D-erythritol kinase [Clostridia bacterium]|nr:4-(cytidine 5'-diphospho)-2-C-methyl-D-erythritol kinase [Clostridia bacterium]
MNEIELRSYAKINLTLDVKGVLDNGMHIVEMVMQQILLCDDVSMRWEPAETSEELRIILTTNRKYLPTDERNLAYKAALLMNEKYGPFGGTLRIHIKKRIPVAAGLAGGSSNGATVLHGLNLLWNLGLDVAGLCETGGKLGSDVPFCIMGQAAENINLKERFADDPLATHCALAGGTGTDLRPVAGLKSHLVLSKPAVSVSTASVYKGIDQVDIPERPDNEAMIAALKTKDLSQIEENMVNVLENYTLKEYPTVVYTKNKMQKLCEPRAVLMSGSGPTVFGLCDSIEQSKRICEEMIEVNRESYWTRTTC